MNSPVFQSGDKQCTATFLSPLGLFRANTSILLTLFISRIYFAKVNISSYFLAIRQNNEVLMRNFFIFIITIIFLSAYSQTAFSVKKTAISKKPNCTCIIHSNIRRI